MAARNREIGLALGGGAARGLAHIGVLRALVQEGFTVTCLAGTSAGSIVAALYAGGVTVERLEGLAGIVRWHHLTEVVLSHRGPVAGERLEGFVNTLLRGRDFRQLEIPLAVVCTDIVTGEAVVVREGNVAAAVKASCAVPGIFRPVALGGRVLVDGGVTSNVPVRAARALGASTVVAVDLTSQRGRPVEPRNALLVIVRALEIMQRANTEKELAEADLVIQPDLSRYSPFNLNRGRQAIEEGYRAALEAISHFPS